MRRIMFLAGPALALAISTGCAAEHYGGHASSNGPLEADDSVNPHCVEHPEDCPDQDEEEHGPLGTDPDPDPDPTEEPAECGDLDLMELVDAGAVDQDTFIRNFTFSNGTSIASATGFFASMDCLGITNAPGTTMLCIRGKEPDFDVTDGSLSIFTAGTFTGYVIETCDHDLALRAEVDGSGSTKEIAGDGEDLCGGSATVLDWGVSNAVTTIYATQNVEENPEAFSITALFLEGCE